jgi:hypothetical protein
VQMVQMVQMVREWIENYYLDFNKYSRQYIISNVTYSYNCTINNKVNVQRC